MVAGQLRTCTECGETVAFMTTHLRDSCTGTQTLRSGLTEGRKFDQSKTRWDLMVWPCLTEVAEVMTHGAEKYAPDNWKKVEPFQDRYFAAAMRHLMEWRAGELDDSDTKKSHLSHAICCLMFLWWGDHN